MDGFSSIYQQKCVQLQLKPIKAILVLFEKASKRGGQITHLDLSYKSLDSRAIIPIASALQYNITIISLNLGYNLIEKRGCKALAVALSTNATLTHLDLSGNKLGDEGVKYLADALAENCTLTTLLLRNNGIRDAGVCDIASALTANATLQELDLSQNTILSTGGEALATALTHNTSLLKLNLAHTHIPQPAIAAIAQRIGQCAIRNLDVRGNAVDDEALLARLALVPPISSSSASVRPPSPVTQRMRNGAGAHASGNAANDDAVVGEHIASLARSLKKEISLLEPEAEFLSRKLTMKLEDINNFSSSLNYHHTELDSEPPVVELPDQFTDTSLHQPAHTVATLRQLNHHYSQQIEDLKRQLKTQAQVHKRTLAQTTQNGTHSEDNLRAILVDHKEAMSRMERELAEKSKRAVTHAHDLDHVKYAHEQEMKALRSRCADKVKLARERAQEQYDELCADYREYQLKSKAEFMALFNDYEAFKRQHATLQAENARMAAHAGDQTQFIAQMQAHADGWQDRLDAAVHAKEDELKAKQEEIDTLRAENAKLSVWLQSMQKTVSDAVRRPSSTISTSSRTIPSHSSHPPTSLPLSSHATSHPHPPPPLTTIHETVPPLPLHQSRAATTPQNSRSPSKSTTSVSALLDQQLAKLLEGK